jgi:hypothetical protein
MQIARHQRPFLGIILLSTPLVETTFDNKIWSLAAWVGAYVAEFVSNYVSEPMTIHLKRLGIGAVAGFVVALVKYAGDDVGYAFKLFDMESHELWRQLFGYSMASLFPITLGAIGGWMSTENSPPKIFWVALTAPVILVAAVAGPRSEAPHNLPTGKAGWNLEYLSPVSSAYAGEAFAAELAPNSSNPVKRQGEDPFVSGFKLFFGYGKDQTRYRVVIHSVEDDKEKAEAIAKRINKEFEQQLPVPATVGERKPLNRFWPIVLNGWTTYAEAKKLEESVSDLDFHVDDKPYISVEGR